MKIYIFDDDGVFQYETLAEVDPLETQAQDKVVYLLPANCTTVEPIVAEGCVAVWDGESWESVEDHRGVLYWLPEDRFGAMPKVMKDIGPLPDGAKLSPPEMTEEEKLIATLMEMKYKRAAEVDSLTVEVEGMVFDADETSQARMSVAASSMTDDETNVWVLHDNSVVQVTKAQLLQACRLARIAQSAVWTKPYENASA